MKLTKLILAALAGCAVVSSLRAADVTLHMYGSTAYRRATFVSIGALYGAGITNISYDPGSGGSILHTTDITASSPAVAASNVLFQGVISVGSLSNKNVDIYGNWAGSVGGIQSVAADSHPVYNLFIPADGIRGHFSSSSVDVAMSDAFQDNTLVNGNTPGYSAVNDNTVAVLEFVWAKANGSPSVLTNISFYTANTLLSLGSVPLSQFTGNVADATNTVYVTGRNDDSGTRAITYLDDQYSLGTASKQFTVTGTSSNYTIAYFGPGSDGLGDGYISGGSVSTALRATRTAPVIVTDVHGVTTTNNNAYVIGYIGVNDALGSGATANASEGNNTIATITPGASTVPTSTWLTYNGVTWSEPSTREGSYSFYGYEHCDFRNDASTTVQNFAADLIAKQKNEAGAAYIPGTMKVGDLNTTRADDGGQIIHN